MRIFHIWLAIATAFVFTAQTKTTMNKSEIEKPSEPRLPIIDANRTRLSIIEWNAATEWRDSLKQRKRAEIRRNLIRAAKRFDISMTVAK